MAEPQAPGTASVGKAQPKPSEGLPPDTPEAIKAAADGSAKDVTVKAERDALDWLLGASKPVEYDISTKFDTPAGTKELIFHIQQLDGKKIIKLEDEHRKGTGPFAELDDIAFNAALVAEATLLIKDGKREVSPAEPEFIGDLGFGPAMAMELRFKYQPGLLDGVAGQIRSVSGYAPDRVGAAERANEVVQEALGD